MGKRSKDYTLIVRLKGPGTREGRVPLSDLVELGKHVQAAVERVARALSSRAVSQGRRPKLKEIKAECALEVVAMNEGSFELVLDVRRRQQTEFAGMSRGEEATEALVDGLAAFERGGTGLPLGYDTGVLHSVRDIGRVLKDGIDSVEFETKKHRARGKLNYGRALQERVVRLIREPITNERTVEGRLLMADFKRLGTKCRVHPPSGLPVPCTFGEDMMDTVQELLRRNVRVTGEAQTDPDTGRIRSIAIADIEFITEGEEAFEEVTAEEFWEETGLSELAEEQGVQPVARLEDVLGRGVGLWDSDEDFDDFLRIVGEGRQDGESA